MWYPSHASVCNRALFSQFSHWFPLDVCRKKFKYDFMLLGFRWLKPCIIMVLILYGSILCWTLPLLSVEDAKLIHRIKYSEWNVYKYSYFFVTPGARWKECSCFWPAPTGAAREVVTQFCIDLFAIRNAEQSQAWDHLFCMVTQHNSVVSPV